MLLVGGPRDGQGFTEADWRETLAAARRRLEAGSQASPFLRYRPSQDLPEKLPHVLIGDIVTAWRWT